MTVYGEARHGTCPFCDVYFRNLYSHVPSMHGEKYLTQPEEPAPWVCECETPDPIAWGECGRCRRLIAANHLERLT